MNIHRIPLPPNVMSMTRSEGCGMEIEVTTEHQLEFKFDSGPSRQFKIAVTDSIHGRRLAQLVTDLVPEYVLDLRDVLRFDLPGLSRDSFFNMLSAQGVHYERAPMGWQAISTYGIVTEATLPHQLYDKVIERNVRNLVLLVSRSEHALHTHTLLNFALSINHELGWEIERVA